MCLIGRVMSGWVALLLQWCLCHLCTNGWMTEEVVLRFDILDSSPLFCKIFLGWLMKSAWAKERLGGLKYLIHKPGSLTLEPMVEGEKQFLKVII